MRFSDIARLRLNNQRLVGTDFGSAHEVVSHLGAVQAQDFAAAKWGVGMRMKKATDQDVEDQFNSGKILRTHMMRPTWHFVTPSDIRWILQLTSPRVQAMNAHMYKKTELDETIFFRSHDILRKALQGKKFLTRAEIAKVFSQNRIEATGQRLAYILMHAELEGVICSGPRIGKQFSYALLEERAPKAIILEKEDALQRLIIRYFTSHGPAQAKDFSWWSGLSMKDVIRGLELAKTKLQKEEVDGKFYYFSPNITKVRDISVGSMLLSIFDEYTIAYRDRSALGEGRKLEKLLMMGNALTAVIVHDGVITGTWKRAIKKNSLRVFPNFFDKPTEYELHVFQKSAQKYADFLGLRLII